MLLLALFEEVVGVFGVFIATGGLESVLVGVKTTLNDAEVAVEGVFSVPFSIRSSECLITLISRVWKSRRLRYPEPMFIFTFIFFHKERVNSIQLLQ